MRTIVLAAIVLALAAAHAPAAITVEAYYRGGETEGKNPGDTWAFGAGTQAVLDASGNGKSVRAAANSSAVAHAIPEVAGSSVAYDGFLRPFHTPSMDSNLIFDGTGNPSAFQNWGVELWFRADTDTDSSFLAMLGLENLDSGRGIGLLQDGAKVVAFYPGSGTSGNEGVQIDIGSDPDDDVATGEWAYMAVVNEAGTNTMYLNDQVVGTWNASPDMSLHNGNDPLEYWKLGFGYTNTSPFLGDIDELRVFSFESGQFQTSDLLIPEPATMGLLAVGGLGMLLKRKRS
jgi:hypothetical protein